MCHLLIKQVSLGAQARTDARAEAEAAAEQRVAAALTLERRELDKQVRSLLCMCSTWSFTALACFHRDEYVICRGLIMLGCTYDALTAEGIW